ncbi:unnamed protein product [Dimorphilus gyrociliatus]|uniref:Ion transport domain-containing protein n=1 Tax=Dimorphilus gyrociliatus TaxID=2664684 RepID=A0A7I8V8R7_9ANNE|nr:unnamed protein product [Dimorphilus gyrociliatus]
MTVCCDDMRDNLVTIIFDDDEHNSFRNKGKRFKRQFIRYEADDGEIAFDRIVNNRLMVDCLNETSVFFGQSKKSIEYLSDEILMFFKCLFNNNTWLITDGLNNSSSVSQRIGHLFKNEKSIFIIGVCYGILEFINFDKSIVYDKKNQLQHNHKTFFYLNDQNDYLKFMQSFQRKQLLNNLNYYNRNLFRSVFIVAGGDESTILQLKSWNRTVSNLILMRDGNDDNDTTPQYYEYPIFIIKGSGQIADILAKAVEIIRDTSFDNPFEEFEREMDKININCLEIGMSINDFYIIAELNERKRICILTDEECKEANETLRQINKFQIALKSSQILDRKVTSLSYLFSVVGFQGNLFATIKTIDTKLWEAISEKALIPYYDQLFSKKELQTSNKLHILLNHICKPTVKGIENRIVLIMYYVFGKKSNILYRPFGSNDRQYAIWDLLIFGILSHNTCLIDYLLYKTNPVASSLVASVILNGLAIKSKEYGLLNLYEELTESGQRYNMLAKKIYHSLFDKYWNKCDIFLDAHLPFDRNSERTILEIALNCNMKHLLAEPGVQKNVDSMWKSNKVPSQKNDREKSIFNWILTPQLKFFLNIFFYLSFLSLFSYFILILLNPISIQSIGVIEVLLLIWVSGLMMEEMRQIYYTSAKVFPYKEFSKIIDEDTKHFSVDFYYLAKYRDIIINYLSSNWNIIDILSIICFFTSFTLRCLLGIEKFVLVRIFYGITLILMSSRVLQFMNYIKFLGPKVLTMLEMTKDLVRFLMVAGVFLLSFGVAYQAMVGKWVKYSGKAINILAAIFGDPFWRIFGELNLEKLNEDSGRHDILSWLLPILIGVYLIVMNILLINLLIAIFSSSYNRIEQETELLWSVQSVKLTFEYLEELYIPPPLNLIDYSIRIIMFLWKKYMRCCGENKNIECLRIGKSKTFNKVEETKIDTSASINSVISHLTKFPDDSLNDLMIEVAGNVAKIGERLNNIEQKLKTIM